MLDINEPDNDGNTPIHHAAMSGNPNIGQWFFFTAKMLLMLL